MKSSRTAQGVALERALLSDMGILADHEARGMLRPQMAAILKTARQLPLRLRVRSVTLAGLAARVLWFDDQIAKALAGGIDQVVVVGAGYDSRPWRLRRDGVRFFEVDHPATQRDKRRRAPGHGPTYVEADLLTQSAMQRLSACGLILSRPAIYLFEGVSMYLSEAVVSRQLRDLGESSTGSRLVLDFLPPRGFGTLQNHRQDRVQRIARTGSGEGLGLLVDPLRAAELVAASGWLVDEVTSMRHAASALLPRRSGLPIDAINEYKTLLAASLDDDVSASA
jgi:methyltransferase (TIGR00027 family)